MNALSDALSGKTYKLNSVIMPAIDKLNEISSKFPRNDFAHDFFEKAFAGGFAFINTLFNDNENKDFNCFKKYIKNINSNGASLLAKLIAIHYIFALFANVNRAQALKKINITKELMLVYLFAFMGTNDFEQGLVETLQETFEVDQASYSVKWVRAVYNNVLGQSGTPKITEVMYIRQILHETYMFFVTF